MRREEGGRRPTDEIVQVLISESYQLGRNCVRSEYTGQEIATE